MIDEFLHEDVFTLTVSPQRVVGAGEIVRVSFVCANVGGGVAESIRVRFNLPAGLVYRDGTADVDGTPLAASGDLFAAGAAIGDLAPHAEHTVTLEYRVANVIEDGTPLALQATLVVDGEHLGSNIVKLSVRSRPVLENAGTTALLESPHDARPDTLRVVSRIHNTGESSANDIIVTLPAPEGTEYVAASARRDGISVEPAADMTFMAERLAPNETAQFEYLVRIAGVITGHSVSLRRVRIASREIPEFMVPPSEAAVGLVPSFAGDALRLDIGESPVTPGVAMPLAVTLRNESMLRVDDVVLRVVLPAGMRLATGSQRVGGRALAGTRITPADQTAVFRFDRISPGETIAAACDAYVLSPVRDGERFAIRAEVESFRQMRSVERSFTVRSGPAFDSARNTCEIAGPSTVLANEATPIIVHVVNDGTSPATNTNVRIAQTALQIRRPLDASATADPWTLDLGTLEPNVPRVLRFEAAVPSPIADGTRLPFAITIAADGLTPLELPVRFIVAESRPVFADTTSWLTHVDQRAVRSGETTRLRVSLTNTGSDVARDLRVTLAIPAEAELASVDGATARDSVLHFGELEPGGVATADLRIRLLEPIPEERSLSIGGTLSATNVRSRNLEEATIATRAEASFAGAAVTTNPTQSVRAGEPVGFILRMDNTGDGPAYRVMIGVEASEGLTYARGSTTVNGISVVDGAAGPALFTSAGLVLEGVRAGAAITIEWRAFTDTTLTGGTTINVRARLKWDNGETTIASPPIRVESRPAFAIRSNGLGFRIATAVQPGPQVETPAAPPVAVNETAQAAAQSTADRIPEELPLPGEPPDVADSFAGDTVIADEDVPDVVERAEAETIAPAPSEHVAHEPQAYSNGSAIVDVADAVEMEQVPVFDPEPNVAVAEEAAPHQDTEVERSHEDLAQHVAEHVAEHVAAPAAAPEEAVARFAITLDAPRIEKLERFLAQAKFEGLITHVFSLRAFFPEIVIAEDGAALEALLIAERDALRSVLDRLFIKVRIPNYDITPSDIEDRNARNALVVLIEAIVDKAFVPLTLSSSVYSETCVSPDELQKALRAVREAPLGDLAPFRTLVHFMPQTVHGWPELGEALSRYRDLLHQTFESIATEGNDAFGRALFSYSTPELDTLREQIVGLLAVPASISP